MTLMYFYIVTNCNVNICVLKLKGLGYKNLRRTLTVSVYNLVLWTLIECEWTQCLSSTIWCYIHHGCLYVHTQLILKEFDFLAFSCLIIPVVASINALIFQSNKGNIIAFVDRCKNCHCNSSHCNPKFSNPRFWKLQIIRTGP